LQATLRGLGLAGQSLAELHLPGIDAGNRGKLGVRIGSRLSDGTGWVSYYGLLTDVRNGHNIL
jgi:hypothetical protein